MPPTRRVGSRTSRLPESEDLPDLDSDQPARAPDDPAHVAAGLMLGHALAAAGTSFEEAGRDGTVCTVLVPSPDWAEAVREAWRVRARSGEHCDYQAAGRSWTQRSWAAWALDRAPDQFLSNQDKDAFPKAVCKGVHCLGIAPDLSWLPKDLMQAADYRLTLPMLTGADLGVLARQLCGDDPTVSLSDDEAAAVTPRLLRLARRPGQAADVYLLKLRDVLGRERETAPAAASGAAADTPRDTPTLDRLHGMDEAVAWGRALARDLAAYRTGSLPWSAVDRGCLLSGPPGCGKTLFARALAKSCDVPLVLGSYGQWLGTGGGHQGDLLRAMRRSFADARARAPTLLFIDEVDSFPDRARVTHRYREWDTQVVNALLAEIDGVQGREGVVLLAACNHPGKLDPALVRSGRLDRHVRVGLPDRAALEKILREHLGGDLTGEDLSGVALAAAGASGADCERYVRGARRRARAANRAMQLADLMSEIGGDDERSVTDQRLAAVHEAGHAVAVCTQRPGGLSFVSLQQAGNGSGRTSLKSLESEFLRAADVHGQLVSLLAGRAAEEEVLGAPSSGAGGGPDSDLARATGLALWTVASFGLDGESGLMWRGMPDPLTLPDTLAGNPPLAARVQAMLDRAYADARALVRTRRAAVEALADALIACRVLDGAEVAAIIGRHLPVAAGAPGIAAPQDAAS